MHAVSVYACYIATKINLIINNRVSLHNSMNFHIVVHMLGYRHTVVVSTFCNIIITCSNRIS